MYVPAECHGADTERRGERTPLRGHRAGLGVHALNQSLQDDIAKVDGPLVGLEDWGRSYHNGCGSYQSTSSGETATSIAVPSASTFTTTASFPPRFTTYPSRPVIGPDFILTNFPALLAIGTFLSS